jgi:hypothetical protein
MLAPTRSLRTPRSPRPPRSPRSPRSPRYLATSLCCTHRYGDSVHGRLSSHGAVTAQSRRSHRSVTAQSGRSHGAVTAQSRRSSLQSSESPQPEWTVTVSDRTGSESDTVTYRAGPDDCTSPAPNQPVANHQVNRSRRCVASSSSEPRVLV